MRSGTLDTPAVVGLAAAVEIAVADAPRRAAMLAGLRDDLVGKVLAVGARRAAQRRPGHRPDRRRARPGCPATRTCRSPGCEGDSLLMLLDAQGIECSTGSACTAGVAQPSHVLLAMGADEAAARGSLRFSLGHTSTAADVEAVAAVIGQVVERARGPGAAAQPHGSLSRSMRVLAAMSGGVDSAVAAARAVRRGARRGRRAPGAVGDAGRAARRAPAAAARGRTPATPAAPPTCWTSRSTSGISPRGSAPTWSTTSSPPTPPGRPRTRACAATRRSSSRRCWTGRSALGFDAVCTGHYARLCRDSGRAQLRRAVDADKDQSYVLAVLTAGSCAHAMFPIGDTPKARSPGRGRRARAAGGRQAGQPRHLLHPLRRHPRLPGRAARRAPGRGRSTPGPGEVLARHDGVHGFTVGQRKGLGVGRPAADGRPRYVLGIEPASGTVRVGPADGAGRVGDRRAPSGVERRAPRPRTVPLRRAGAGARRRWRPRGAAEGADAAGRAGRAAARRRPRPDRRALPPGPAGDVVLAAPRSPARADGTVAGGGTGACRERRALAVRGRHRARPAAR